MPGSLFLTTERPKSAVALLELLRAECRRRGKRHGLWIRGLRTFAQQQGAGGHGSIRLMAGLVYLVDAETGELTLVRDLDAVGTPLVLLGNMLAAGDDAQARDLLYGAPMSVVVPSLLLSEVELQRAETRPEKLPILPAPGARRTAERRGTPFVPVVPHSQALRFVVRGGAALKAFEVPAAAALRMTASGADLTVDVKVTGATLPLFAEAARAVDAQVDAAAEGRPVERSALTPLMTETSYAKKHGPGLPSAPAPQ